MSASLHSTNSMRRTILAILIVLGVIVIDQLIKFDIKTTFMLHEDYVVARDWFHILFTENRGMAFGMQFVGTMFLALFRVVAIGLFCVLVDMFYFPLFTWPDWVPLFGGNTFFGAIFNFADASISCGAVALVLFYHKYISNMGLLKK